MFLLKKAIKLISAQLQLVCDLALRRLHLGPSSICENLSNELNAGDDVTFMLCELALHLTRQSDVLKHLNIFLHLVGATLHFEFLNHQFLVLP